jgi:hypothetical protein
VYWKCGLLSRPGLEDCEKSFTLVPPLAFSTLQKCAEMAGFGEGSWGRWEGEGAEGPVGYS